MSEHLELLQQVQFESNICIHQNQLKLFFLCMYDKNRVLCAIILLCHCVCETVNVFIMSCHQLLVTVLSSFHVTQFMSVCLKFCVYTLNYMYTIEIFQYLN